MDIAQDPRASRSGPERYTVRYTRPGNKEVHHSLGGRKYRSITEAERVAAQRSRHNQFTYIVYDDKYSRTVTTWRRGTRYAKTQNQPK